MLTRLKTPLHVAVIMDGNGRWATRRGLPRSAGHREGAKAVRRTVEAAAELGLSTLTLFAFSSDNWKRPRREVSVLMSLLSAYLEKETSRCQREGIRLTVIGRRDRLSRKICERIAATERATAGGNALHLRIAVDYSGRDAILRAVAELSSAGILSREALSAAMSPDLAGASADVDLLIRTGGERRLSDFLLWDCAYAELLFSPALWPDFGAAELAAAVAEFRDRNRRFGELPEHTGKVIALHPRTTHDVEERRPQAAYEEIS